MKCKSILGIIVISVCLMGMYTVQAVEATKVYVETPETAKVGDVITAKVMVDSIDSSAVGLKLDVQYDADRLEYVSDQAGEKAKGTMNLSKHVPEEQRVRVGIVALLGLRENGCYYEVQFKVKEVASTTTSIDVKVAELTDSSGTELAYTTSATNLRIEGSEPVQEQETPKEEPDNTTTNPLTTEGETPEGETQEAPETTNPTKQPAIQIPLLSATTSNIKDYFTQEQPEELSWNIQDVQIAELKEDGTIVPKQAGNTNIIITDKEGNVVAEYPLEITEEEAPQKQKTNMGVLIVIMIIGAVVGTIIGFEITKQKTKK